MISEFIKSCQKVVKKVWGKEYWIENIPDYCGKLLVINDRHRSSIHYHKIKKETFFVLTGLILFEIGDSEPIVMARGDSITINPYTKHRFTGLRVGSEFIEFSSQHFEHDSYRDTQSEKIPEKEWLEIYEKYYGPID